MPALNRRSFLATAVATGLGSEAGCISAPSRVAYRSFGYGSHNRGFSGRGTGPSLPVEPVWEFGAAKSVQTPAVVDGTVFAASTRNTHSTVVALDASTGAKQWEYVADAPLEPQWTPTVSDGILCFIDSQGIVHGVDTEDGTRVWKRNLPREQGRLNAPLATDGAFVFSLGTQTLLEFGGLYALEATDGTIRWHKSPDSQTNRHHTPPVPAADGTSIYYATLAPPEVTAISATHGRVIWRTPLEGDTGYTGVAVAGDHLYLGGPQGQAAFSLEERTIEWRSPGGFRVYPPTVGDEATIVSLVEPEDVGIRAVDEAGEELWRRTTAHFAEPGPSTIADGVVYYGANGHLHARDSQTGKQIFRTDPDYAVGWTPVVLDDTVLTSGPSGLLALQPTAGR